MKKWLRRLRAALGMGLTWAAGWTPVGVVVGLIMGFGAGLPTGSLVGVWVVTLATLGFLGGTIFSSVLRLAEGRRRFDELSLPRFGAVGAVGGLLLGVLAVTAGLVGAGFGPGLWVRDAVIIGTATLLSGASAAGSLVLARMADGTELLEPGAGAGDSGILEDETWESITAGR